ncbi:MAG TPA: DUF4442 domain-containing protein [Vicinamibacteria bacterium]|nr:DUF4442 domain-containing protein [Vicinamibacteria bacterium]
MTFGEPAETFRRQLLAPWRFRLGLVRSLPLAAAAGLRLTSLDGQSCTVALPGGWRTRNPFRSTYFAAQAMAAEMSTGAPASVLVRAAPASVSMLVTEVRGVFTKKIVGESVFTFAGVPAMRDTVERAARSGEAMTFVARSVGRATDGTVAAEFEITWSFKRRS